jgi:carboxypeptidase Taq
MAGGLAALMPYARLEAAFARHAKLSAAARKLGWDQKVTMPAGGAVDRGEELAVLAAVAHEIIASPCIADDLAAAANLELTPPQAANLREMRRLHMHAAGVPSQLVAVRETLSAACELAWRQARAIGDFKAILVTWEPLISVIREVGAAKAEALGVTPYEALMDPYDPGRPLSQVNALFDDLEPFLKEVLPKAMAVQMAGGRPMLPAGGFPLHRQRQLGERLMTAVGYSFHHGRLDDTLHPFSTGSAGDARVTARWDARDFTSGLMAVLHETGHALYTRGGDPAWQWQPVGSHRGMTIHESQSLFLEMQIGRSRAFTGFWAGLAREAFGGDGPGWNADNLYRWVTRVAPGFIRVEADAVTYPLHVILRFRLEQALIAGTLRPADLPEAWNAGMEDLLGIRPPSPREGCLQDIHWYGGSFGYFPSYSLGAMAAAQLFQAAERDLPGMHESLGQGDVAPVVGWLGAAVHRQGCLQSADELLTRATGRPLDTAAFKAHIRQRYL